MVILYEMTKIIVVACTKLWYTVKHGTWNGMEYGMESAVNKIILHSRYPLANV